MRMFSVSVIVLLMTSLSVGAGEYSHDHDDEEFIEHQSHVHGRVQVNISNFEDSISLEFIFPSKDIFGFEHEPHNDSQQATVTKQLEVVNDADQIFVSDRQCKLTEARVESNIANGDKSDAAHSEHEEDHHDHAEDNHAEAHHDHHEEEHHHDQSKGEHEDGVHSDVFANYIMECDTDKDIQITFKVFEAFPTIEELQIRYVSEQGQDTTTVTSGKNTYTLR